MKRLSAHTWMRRLSLILFLISSALHLSAEEPAQHPFTINASGAQVLLEPGSTLYSWNEVAANPEGFLTKVEWEYLLANNRWRFLTRGTVGSEVFGMVLYPIDFPEGSIIGGTSGFPGEPITEDEWTALEADGARFLYYKNAGIALGYWTTTAADGDNGYYVMFQPGQTPTVTCGKTAAKTTTKLFVRVTRLAPPSCDCFTIHF